MDIQVMERQANQYNDLSLSGEISSATSIREHYKLSGEYVAVPDEIKSLYKNNYFIKANDISEILHYKLISVEDFEPYLDCNRDLSDRINNYKKDFISFTQFCELVKSKNYEYSRISRVLCHILLGIKNEEFRDAKENSYITYIRMLGFSKNGNKLLKSIKKNSAVPLITEPNEIVNKYDLRSADILRAVVTSRTGEVIDNEYTRKFDLVNIEN